MRNPKPSIEETVILVGGGIALGVSVLGTAFFSGAAVGLVQGVLNPSPTPPAQVETTPTE